MSRAIIFGLLGLGLTIVLGPLHELLHMDILIVDAPLLVVLYLAVSSNSTVVWQSRVHATLSSTPVDWPGGLCALLLGYLTDLLGSGTKGVHCLSLTVLFLFARRAARHIYLFGIVPVMLIGGLSSLGTSVVGLAVHWMDGVPPTTGSVTTILAQAALTAAVAPLLFRLFGIVDHKLAPSRVGRGLI